MSELKDWEPQPGGYGEEFRKEIQAKVELIDELIDDINSNINELSEYSDNNTVTERVEEILKFFKKSLKIKRNDLTSSKARIRG